MRNPKLFDASIRLSLYRSEQPTMFTASDIRTFHPVESTRSALIAVCAESHDGVFYIRIYTTYDSAGTYSRFTGPYRTIEAAVSVITFVTGEQVKRIGETAWAQKQSTSEISKG